LATIDFQVNMGKRNKMMKQPKTMVLLVLIGLFAVTTACSAETQVASAADESTTTNADATDTTSSSEPSDDGTSSTASAAEDDGWEDITGWSGATFGMVRALFFEPAFTFEVPDGAVLLCPPGPTHTGVSLRSENVTISPVPSAVVPSGLHALRLADETTDDTVATLTEGVSEPTEPTPTAIGGAEGVTFDASAPEAAETLYISSPGDCSVKFDIAERLRFWVVDVDGVPVTFVAWASAAEFDAEMAGLQPIIESVSWRAPLGES
jgi:hypothetical protein